MPVGRRAPALPECDIAHRTPIAHSHSYHALALPEFGPVGAFDGRLSVGYPPVASPLVADDVRSEVVDGPDRRSADSEPHVRRVLGAVEKVPVRLRRFRCD